MRCTCLQQPQILWHISFESDLDHWLTGCFAGDLGDPDIGSQLQWYRPRRSRAHCQRAPGKSQKIYIPHFHLLECPLPVLQTQTRKFPHTIFIPILLWKMYDNLTISIVDCVSLRKGKDIGRAQHSDHLWSHIQPVYSSSSCKSVPYISLTECEGRTGRISAWGLGSTDRAASARSVQERPRADILPVRSRANSVNKRFITWLLVSEKTRTANATSIQRAKIARNLTIVPVQFNHNWHCIKIQFFCLIHRCTKRFMPDRDSVIGFTFFDKILKLSAAVRNDLAIMFSSFLGSSQIVSHVQTKLKVGAFMARTTVGLLTSLCFEEKVCKSQSPPHPPFWKVWFPVWYAQNRSDIFHIFRVIWLEHFLYQPSQELSHVIIDFYQTSYPRWEMQ